MNTELIINYITSDLGKTKEEIVKNFINPEKGVKTYEDAVTGAKDIIAENIADNEIIRAWMREKIKSTGKITSKVKKEWKEKESKYKIYYEFSELLKDSPSHRMLAISRGTNEDVLVWKIEVNDDEIIRFIESNIIRQNDFIFHEELKTAIQDSFMRLLFPSIEKYITHEFGIPTLTDILNELKKPGIDPRKEFASLEFSSEINEINDLKEGMTLSGTVTNVTNFGAFVDIGVHQDGLIHISKLANRFVKNPHDIVSVGDIVKIKVLSIDVPLKRISLEKI